ncbi:MAG: hypothetical protein ACHQ4G_10475 [Opitutales bacterium]
MRNIVLTFCLVVFSVGLYSVIFPRAIIVPHQSYRYGKNTAEVILPRMVVAYGIGATALAAIAFYCAWSWPKWNEEEEEEQERNWHGPGDKLE